MGTKFTKVTLAVLLVVIITLIAAGAAVGEQQGSFAGYDMEAVFYIVKDGDCLSVIAQRTEVTVASLVRANKLSGTIIYPGQALVLPGQVPDFKEALSRGFSRDDVMLLARAIYAEARGENFTGQVAVGAVILNRMKNHEFPKTLEEVIMQKNSGVYQFSPVKDGSINLQPDDTAICAAIRAISGHDPTNGALFFYNPMLASDQWIRTLPVMTRIGNHVFASKA